MARTEIPPGTLYLLILKTLESGPRHGYGIASVCLSPWPAGMLSPASCLE
jgi:hypothetical protein